MNEWTNYRTENRAPGTVGRNAHHQADTDTYTATDNRQRETDKVVPNLIFLILQNLE